MRNDPPDPWLEGRYHADLHPEAERALRAAGRAWQDEVEAKRLLDQAEDLAPGHMAVLIARYRFAFYKHDHALALVQAERLLTRASRRLNIPGDWRIVRPDDGDFSSEAPDVRFWMFTLQAYGYVLLRLGREAEGLAAWQALAALDARNQTRTRLLLAAAAHRDSDEM